ncbi:MAG TPA: beta-L-arabinofuranosidase domain-containing protein [Nocardioidaceae bacterium]|nr:beta-L-arabinofuranosidase domain-containing protein [Nocardioidaceae bacterium]
MPPLAHARAESARLLDGPALKRAAVDRDYLMSLTVDNLLRPYRLEAGLWAYSGSVGTTIGVTAADGPGSWHWGWESPTSELRGHFLGHWLSAAAYFSVHDPEVRTRADLVVRELRRCQDANGGEWVAAFPPDYLRRVEEGVPVWAPQYTIHKLLMGLWDMHAVAGSAEALEALTRFARWFGRWTEPMSREQLDDVLDVETGGMLEIWADLYGETGDPAYLELLRRYDRPRFFDRLLAGEDVLTNRHANTQIPETLGAARAWEVTGEPRWRRIVEEFWQRAVRERGTYCTGGSTSAEVWQPDGVVLTRLHDVQEHCVVYNLMRLAETLYRWTGDAEYAEYWERNLVNGIFSQQNPRTGMVTYFQSLEPGSTKHWGSPTSHFWCCHGTLLQAHSHHATAAVQRDAGGLRVSQFIPSTTTWDDVAGGTVTIRLEQDPLDGVVFGQNRTAAGFAAIQRLVPELPARRPRCMVYRITVQSTGPDDLVLRVRAPEWLAGDPTVEVDGRVEQVETAAGWLVIPGLSDGSSVRLAFPTRLRAVPVPDDAGVVSFAEGPYVLVGLSDRSVVLRGDAADADGLLTPDDERGHNWWNAGVYRTRGDHDIRFVPLLTVDEEPYTAYFRVVPA